MKRLVAHAAMACFLLLVPAQSAAACGAVVRVTFVESTPDRFMIEFLDGPGQRLTSISIDLTGSRAGAFVDTLYGPNLDDTAMVDRLLGFAHGGVSGRIEFRHFVAGKRVDLLVDLDDRMRAEDQNPDVLTPNEIAGADASAELRDTSGTIELLGTFDDDGVAHLGNRACG